MQKIGTYKDGEEGEKLIAFQVKIVGARKSFINPVYHVTRISNQSKFDTPTIQLCPLFNKNQWSLKQIMWYTRWLMCRILRGKRHKWHDIPAVYKAFSMGAAIHQKAQLYEKCLEVSQNQKATIWTPNKEKVQVGF